MATNSKNGITRHDVAKKLNVQPSTASARMRELEQENVLVKTTKTREHKGFDQHVYVDTFTFNSGDYKRAPSKINCLECEKLKQEILELKEKYNDN